jgi:hypothetical protein
MLDRGDQEAHVEVVDAGDGVAEADGRLAGEAGGESQHPLLAGRAGQFAGVKGGDGGFPVDRGRAGTVMDEPGEVIAFYPGAWAMISAVAASSA